MAIILVLDRAAWRWNTPTIRKVICDGFVMFSEEWLNDETKGLRLNAGGEGVDVRLLAKGLVQLGVGEDVREGIKAELERLAAEMKHEEIKKRWEEVRNDRPGNDGGPAGGDAGESGNGQ